MKSIFNLKKKTSNSTNTSKLNGMHSKENKSSPFFYLVSICITNLCVYLLCTSSVQPSEKQITERVNYSEIVLSLELKTPFKEGKLINIYDSRRMQTYSDIYFHRLSEEDNQVFESSEQSKVILYVPNHLISELTQAKGLVAVPYQSMMETKKRIVKIKESYEITY